MTPPEEITVRKAAMTTVIMNGKVRFGFRYHGAFSPLCRTVSYTLWTVRPKELPDW